VKKVSGKYKGTHVAIFPRPGNSEALKHSRDIAHWLADLKISVASPFGKKLGAFVEPLANSASINKTLDKLDLAIVIGGDGTYLRAAQILDGRPIPILGINMGSLGFLTVTRVADSYKAILDTLEKKMDFISRSILEVTFVRRGKIKSRQHAINDAVIERSAGGHLINLGLYFEKQLVCELKADGITIASPTGSTAYNLAAGGPIIHPDSRVFVCTPLNSHSLTTRPIVVPDNQTISIKLLSQVHPAFLTIDGENKEQLHPNDEVIIKRNDRDHLIVREPSHNYFNILRDKLKFGERA